MTTSIVGFHPQQMPLPSHIAHMVNVCKIERSVLDNLRLNILRMVSIISQPLDLGIIKNFKVHYRCFLLRYVLSKIDQCKTASEVTSSLNILMAITQAWKDVKEETIRKCFRSAGILDSSMDVVSCDMGEDDPFADVDSDADLQGLVADIMPETERCNA